MPPPLVIVHERVANWSRQLRPRFQEQAIRWSESRSTANLLRAAAGATCPIVVMEVDGRATRILEDLDEALQVAPMALSLVLEPRGRGEVIAMARELGATLVMGGRVVPPEVERIVRRWLSIADRRAEAEGWSPLIEPEPEPWERPELFFDPRRTDPLADEPN